jgi:hypothetical protein
MIIVIFSISGAGDIIEMRLSFVEARIILEKERAWVIAKSVIIKE